LTPDSGAAAPSVASPLADTARIALVGNPNSGKTALFNALTGSRQKVANYAGVTVERKEGVLTAPSGRQIRVLDLPGTYSLRARSPDEAVTRDAVLGKLAGEDAPQALVWPPVRAGPQHVRHRPAPGPADRCGAPVGRDRRADCHHGGHPQARPA
jgi:ferrous iron transport protein B